MRKEKFNAAMKSAISTMTMYEFLNIRGEARNQIKKLDTYDLDIFKLRDNSLEHELQGIVMIALSKRGILTQVDELNVEKLTRFLTLISRGYKNISYHNKTHGSDVCQTFNYFLQGDGLIKKCKMTYEESMAYLIAAVCHDYEHPGVNNVFLTQIRD